MEDRQCAWRQALREAEASHASLEPPEARGRGLRWDQGDSLCARVLSVERDAHYTLCKWLKLGPVASEPMGFSRQEWGAIAFSEHRYMHL